jgi:hypothetical protein
MLPSLGPLLGNVTWNTAAPSSHPSFLMYKYCPDTTSRQIGMIFLTLLF